jgi:TRAP-type mannitol/chloroaromatic compound transport system permease small subunit
MKREPIVDRISRTVGNGLSALFLVAVALTVYEVFLRYVFNAPTVWVHDVVIVLSAVCFVFGGALASQQRIHIQMASYTENVRPRVRRTLDLICQVLTAAYLVMFLYAALRMAIPSLELMETSGRAWDVPIPAFLKTVLALGMFLMLAQTLSDIWHRKSQTPDRTAASETIV